MDSWSLYLDHHSRNCPSTSLTVEPCPPTKRCHNWIWRMIYGLLFLPSSPTLRESGSPSTSPSTTCHSPRISLSTVWGAPIESKEIVAERRHSQKTFFRFINKFNMRNTFSTLKSSTIQSLRDLQSIQPGRHLTNSPNHQIGPNVIYCQNIPQKK